ncbi:MAG: acyl-CoA thioesterase [Oligoflexia bacterium]|nr:acyl-CoA thioesterase [Oligoflexia bacterium]
MGSKAKSTPSLSEFREPAIREVMMPRDVNPLGSIFGGHILSLIDLAAGQYARTVAPRKYVTKVMREVVFISPVNVGDIVSFYCSTKTLGTTSITIVVDVESVRGEDALHSIKVTSAEVVMVAVDSNNRPTPIMAARRGKARGPSSK